MSEKNYTVLFDFKTQVNENIEDLVTDLPFVPTKGLTIFIDEEHIKFPEDMKSGDWFIIDDVDYILKDNLFVVALRTLGKFEME